MFKPLLALEIADAPSRIFIADYFKYRLKNMPSQTNEIYRLALKHMEKPLLVVYAWRIAETLYRLYLLIYLWY